LDDWRTGDAAFRELEIVAERVKKPHPELLRICVRAVWSCLITIAFAVRHMATKAAASSDASVSSREREVLAEYVEPAFPGAPRRRIEASTSESLTVGLSVYGRARRSEPPLEPSPLGHPVVPESVGKLMAIHDRITHPESVDDMVVGKTDVRVLQDVLRWATGVRKWLNTERLAEIAEARDSINQSFEEARRRLMEQR
jgi:hypothetical protein